MNISKDNFKINASVPKGNIWLEGLFGIEKENIRVDRNGDLSQTPHPAVFGNKAKHPYITTDFSESQIEMITPPLPDIKQTIGFLETLHDIISLELKDEYLWQQSTPPVLPDEKQIPIAQYEGEDYQRQEYREKLAEKYGRKNQMLSGIHFNLSFDENLLQMLYRKQNSATSFDDFKDAAYMKTTRQLLRFRWLYILLFGNSPVVDSSFELKCKMPPFTINKNVTGLSLRNSCYGYRNMEELFPDYSSASKYLDSIEGMIGNGKLSSPKELYTSVRPKFFKDSNKISYLEIRFIDIDPLIKTGVTEESLYFLHLLSIYSLLKDEQDSFDSEAQLIANRNFGNAALNGLNEELFIFNNQRLQVNAWEEAINIIDDLVIIYNQLGINDNEYCKALSYLQNLVRNPSSRRVYETLTGISKHGFINFHLEKAELFLQESKQKSFNFFGLEDMELSTQLVLREAVKRGVNFEILDREENFIRLQQNNNIQYVKQATKTSLDNYASILAMENKIVTKKILDEHGIRVPKGLSFTSSDSAKNSFMYFKEMPVVVKPKLTNFGIGITILKENNNESLFSRAVDIAFENDSSIIIEEFIEGKEFRFFVMEDEVAAVLQRVPANVSGDGINTIAGLVTEKNKNPLRGKGYRTPLEKIKLSEAESIYLKTQDKDFNYVPAKDEIVYLRENSNISTGGDSIDYTDEIPDSYKRIAVKAAQALNVKITGLDMIIPDYTKEADDNNYAIIELNFNPAIHIHCHPYKGKNRKLNEKLLDMLGYSLPN
jgi:glutamate--cysteine ligase